MRKAISAIILILLITNVVPARTTEIANDGQDKIIFVKAEGAAENIWFINRDSPDAVQMTKNGGSNPVVSYDGKFMVYSLGDYREHKNILVDFEKAQVTAMLDSDAYVYSISPNNDKILYTKYADADKYYLKELYISDMNGSNEVKLVSGSDIWEACFSPAENKIAYVKDGFIFVLDLDTKKETQLAYDSPSDGISWAYDGSRIFYAGPEYEIISVSKNGKDRKLIFKDEEILALRPRISPDGKYIVFLNENDTQLYMIESDGTNLMKLTDNKVYDYPMWIKVSEDLDYKVQDDMFIPSPFILKE